MGKDAFYIFVECIFMGKDAFYKNVKGGGAFVVTLAEIRGGLVSFIGEKGDLVSGGLMSGVTYVRSP